MKTNVEETGKLAYSIKDAAAATGLSPATIHKLCNEGHLTRRKVGKRSFILAEELVNFLHSCGDRKWIASGHCPDQKTRV